MKPKPQPQRDIPIWRVPLSFDFRHIFAWALEKFPPKDEHAEMKIVMETAIRDKAEEVWVDALQLQYLENMGCGALAANHPVRIDANRFLNSLPMRKRADSVRTTKPVVEPVKAKQGAFDF